MRQLAGYDGQVAADFRHVIAKQGNGRPSIYSGTMVRSCITSSFPDFTEFAGAVLAGGLEIDVVLYWHRITRRRE